jgi:hypothetical protein
MHLVIEKTLSTPLVVFDRGVLNISGRSIPENSISFFEPLFRCIAQYSKNPEDQTIVNILLEYANSSTNRSLMTVFTLLEKIQESGKDICINWYCEKDDDTMLELGADFKALLRIPFNISQKSFLN